MDVEGVPFVAIKYRTFLNTDPPGLVDIWNEAFIGRGAAQLRNPAPLERYAFCRPYFDPTGLFVAVQDELRIGFAHAGFGPNNNETKISHLAGVTSIVGVRPEYRHRGIGSELLGRCEEYLRQQGARSIYAGSMKPLNPFYFGLYGGSDLPGFLASDEAAGPFLEYHGYRPHDTCLVFQRKLDESLNIADGRFSALRRKYNTRVVPRTGVGTWWQECAYGSLDTLEFRMEEVSSNKLVARAEAWEMEGFSWRWGVPAAGIMSILVREEMRQQGLAKFLVLHILRHLQEQYFGVVEVQTMERNQPAVKLFRSLGFEQVDFGRMYKLDE